jgi:hypothetical protein
MTNPPRADVEIEPLICFWDPMHPHGEAESLFRFPLNPDTTLDANGFDFGHFWVFSMSNYLRGLADDQILLDMPSAAQRIQWLETLVLQVPE